MTIAAAAQPDSAESRTLIVGATGFIGRFVAEACLETGRTTYVLVRSANTTPSKGHTIKDLHDKGAIILQGSINDREFMEKLLKEKKIDVVISAVGGESLTDQLSLIDAIKAVGTVKRFLPSEFGHDIDRADPVEPGLTMYEQKRMIRRAIEEARIPFTYICCNSVAAWPYHDNTHPSEVLPPLDRFQIYGDGTVKAYFVAGTDIGKFTMKAVDDDRTVNKSVHFRPAINFLNINELASLWEKKLARTLPRETVTEEDLLAAAAENIIPRSVVASFTHDIFIKGCQINFSIDGHNDLEATSLYPDTPFRSMADCFDDFAARASVIAAHQAPHQHHLLIASARVEESAATKEEQQQLQTVAGEAAAGEFVRRIDQSQQPQVVGEAPKNSNSMVEVFAITASCA